MEDMSYGKAYKYLLSVLENIDSKKENYNAYKTVYESLKNVAERKEFISGLVTNGIPIKQEPFYNNINMFELNDIANKFEIEKSHADGIKTELMIAPIYYIRLKHEPQDKHSAKSVDSTNMSNLPTKTKDKKNNTSLISNTPIKIGNVLAA